MTQDMFPKGKHAKTISRNAHYIVAFKNPRNQLGVRILIKSILKNNVPISPITMARLRPFKQTLRRIGNRAVSLKKRRQALINQKGGRLWNGLNAVVKTCCR